MALITDSWNAYLPEEQYANRLNMPQGDLRIDQTDYDQILRYLSRDIDRESLIRELAITQHKRNQSESWTSVIERVTEFVDRTTDEDRYGHRVPSFELKYQANLDEGQRVDLMDLGAAMTDKRNTTGEAWGAGREGWDPLAGADPGYELTEMGAPLTGPGSGMGEGEGEAEVPSSYPWSIDYSPWRPAEGAVVPDALRNLPAFAQQQVLEDQAVDDPANVWTRWTGGTPLGAGGLFSSMAPAMFGRAKTVYDLLQPDFFGGGLMGDMRDVVPGWGERPENVNPFQHFLNLSQGVIPSMTGENLHGRLRALTNLLGAATAGLMPGAEAGELVYSPGADGTQTYGGQYGPQSAEHLLADRLWTEFGGKPDEESWKKQVSGLGLALKGALGGQMADYVSGVLGRGYQQALAANPYQQFLPYAQQTMAGWGGPAANILGSGPPAYDLGAWAPGAGGGQLSPMHQLGPGLVKAFGS